MNTLTRWHHPHVVDTAAPEGEQPAVMATYHSREAAQLAADQANPYAGLQA